MTDVLWNTLLACGCGGLVLYATMPDLPTSEEHRKQKIVVGVIAAIEVVVFGLLLFAPR